MPLEVSDLAVKASCAACVVVLMPAGALIVLPELTALAAAFYPVLLADKNIMEIS